MYWSFVYVSVHKVLYIEIYDLPIFFSISTLTFKIPSLALAYDSTTLAYFQNGQQITANRTNATQL